MRRAVWSVAVMFLTLAAAIAVVVWTGRDIQPAPSGGGALPAAATYEECVRTPGSRILPTSPPRSVWLLVGRSSPRGCLRGGASHTTRIVLACPRA